MDSERRYTIAELADASAAALDALGIAARNGQVRDRPDVRTIRYYGTLGLIDPPAEMTGRTARYGGRHLLQVLAVKAVQARGDSLADAQRTLVGASDEELRSAIGPGLPAALAAVPPPALAAAPEGSDARRAAGHPFWRTSPAPPAAVVPAVEPSAEVPESRTAGPGHSSGSAQPESSRRPGPVHARAALAAASHGPHAGDAGIAATVRRGPARHGRDPADRGLSRRRHRYRGAACGRGPATRLPHRSRAAARPAESPGSHTVTTSAAPDAAAPLPAVAGRLGDDSTTLPLTAVEIEAEIRGTVATTTVRQTYRNTHAVGIEATYIFPLPDRAGVTAFTADLAGRRVEGELRERGEARREYDEAITAGHRAAIAEEERSGVFTTRVGNLQPGEDAVITLTLTGPLAVDDGVAEFRFPLVVAPRYIAGQPGDWLPVGVGTAPDTDAVPDASRITPPVLLPGLDSPVRLALRARLSGLGLTPDAIASSLHAVAVTADGDGAVTVALHPGERLNRDVVLRFGVAAEVTAAIAVVTPDEDDPTAGTWQVTVVPPAAGGDAARGRDVVVVLDRSGSMDGWKMVAARRAAARVIDSLGARDRFAVLAFDSVTERPPGFTSLAPATDRARWAAVEWLARLEARGGTEMLDPVRAAATLLAGAGSPDEGEGAGLDESGRDRFLILVTDGQVGAEDQILAAVAALTGRTRIFTLGIDQAVNAGFLRRLAAAGAGRCELVESEGRLDEVMTSLHRRISPPVVTGLRVESATAGCELTAGETAPAPRPRPVPRRAVYAVRPLAGCGPAGRGHAHGPRGRRVPRAGHGGGGRAGPGGAHLLGPGAGPRP